MPDINWNGDASTAGFKSRYDEVNDNLILVEDPDLGTVLLEWDGSAYQFRGPVEMNGENVSGVGTLTATDVVTDSVNTGKQNNNEVNLTRLVGNGTYANIADAIANEPPTNPIGTAHIIEPGEYGPISGQYTIDYSNRVIAAEGVGSLWNTTVGNRQYPVTIRQAAAETQAMFAVPDNSTFYESVEFRGVDFVPEDASSYGHGAFSFEASTSGGLNRDFRFVSCSFRQFGGPGIENSNRTQNYGHKFVDCRFQKSSAQTDLGNQAELRGCYALTVNDGGGNPGLRLGLKSSATHMVLGGATGSDHGIAVGGNSSLHFKNAEGSGTPSGNAGVVVDAAGETPVVLGGQIDNWDTAVRVRSGPIQATNLSINYDNVNQALDFQGGSNSHNGTFVSGEIPDGFVNFANTTQSQVLIISSAILTTSGAAPDPFVLAFHSDADGAGTPGLAFGGNSLVPARYWTGTAF